MISAGFENHTVTYKCSQNVAFVNENLKKKVLLRDRLQILTVSDKLQTQCPPLPTVLLGHQIFICFFTHATTQTQQDIGNDQTATQHKEPADTRGYGLRLQHRCFHNPISNLMKSQTNERTNR